MSKYKANYQIFMAKIVDFLVEINYFCHVDFISTLS